MKLLLLFIFITISSLASGQKNDKNFAIHVEAFASINGNRFYIDIYKNGSSVKTVYGLLDSINDIAMLKDKNFYINRDALMKQMNKRPQNQDSLNKAVHDVKQLNNAYSSYSKDSLTFKTSDHSDYTSLLDSVNSAADTTLENTAVNRSRIVLDGVMIEFNIIADGGSRKVYAHSPTPKSNPLLYKLLYQTLNIYRTTKRNLFLAAGRTSGY